MRMRLALIKLRSVLVLAAICSSGCSDTRVCGDGTVLHDDTCEATPVCVDGTRLNETTGRCEVDPDACQGGTVLIDGRCQDPTADLHIDLEEGAEPNGFDGSFLDNRPALEPGFQPAGAIDLALTMSTGFTVRGCVAPANGKPDVDAYLLRVDGPTLVNISVDGVGGLTGGFVVFSSGGPLDRLWAWGWFRAGVTVTGDAIRRDVFLPVAGDYTIYVSDSRTLLPFIGLSPGPRWNFTLPPYGALDGTSCYYMSIKGRVPEVTPFVSSGVAGGSMPFLGLAGLVGFTQLSPQYELVESAIHEPNLELMLMNGDTLRQIGTGQNVLITGREAKGALFFAARPGDVVVVDDRGSLGSFQYAIKKRDVPAQPLPSDGGEAVLTVRGTQAVREGAQYPYFPELDLEGINLFFLDAPADLFELDIHSSLPLQAALLDEVGREIANWAAPLEYSEHAFTDYTGPVRLPKTGRYYLLSVAPRSTVGDPFSIRSTVSPVNVPVLDLNSETGPLPLNRRQGGNYFTHRIPANTDWHQVNATGSDMGDILVNFFPSNQYGRFADLPATDSADQAVLLSPTAYAVFSAALPEDGSRPATHMVSGHSQLFSVVRAASPGADPTFNLSVGAHPTAVSLGPIAPLSKASRMGVVLTGTAPDNAGRFAYQVPWDSIVTITARPVASFDQPDNRLQIHRITPQGDPHATWDSPSGGVKVARFRESLWEYAEPFTSAVEVRSVDPAAAGTVDVTVRVDPPHYRVATTTATAFNDICSAETEQALTADGSVDSFEVPYPADVHGLSSPIAMPKGFLFYGAPQTNLVVSTCGFASFDEDLGQAPPGEPSAANVAPAPRYCGDTSVQTKVCARREGERLVVQWQGGADVTQFEMQAIFDGRDHSIEFAYGLRHRIGWWASSEAFVQDRDGIDRTSLDSSRVPMRGRAYRFVR